MRIDAEMAAIHRLLDEGHTEGSVKAVLAQRRRDLAQTAAWAVPVGVVSVLKSWALQRGLEVGEAIELVRGALDAAMAAPGAGVPAGTVRLTEADREYCRRAGVDPGKVAATIAAGKAGAR